MRVLITGVTGFVGSHLADWILERRKVYDPSSPAVEVWGACRLRSPMENIEHLRGRSDFHLVDGDLTDSSAVRRILELSKPDFVFHLAAQSFVPTSFQQPRETLNTNIMAEINLLHGLRERLAGGMLIAGSSEEYGLVHPNETPITEDQPLRPLSPYAVSKVAQDLLAYQYFQSYKVNVIRTRAFNHEGPRRGEVFVLSSFAKQIAEIEHGLREPQLLHGNLDAIRDFTDVRDTVRAYWMLMERGISGEVYNIATGLGVRIGDALQTLRSHTSVANIEMINDLERLRPSDVPILIGDATRLRKRTGWTPTIKFDQTLVDMLAHWRERAKKALDKKAGAV